MIFFHLRHPPNPPTQDFFCPSEDNLSKGGRNKVQAAVYTAERFVLQETFLNFKIRDL